MDELKSNWWDLQTEEYLEGFLRDPKEGLDHPSRKASRALVAHLIKRLDHTPTILDIGCGAGVELDNYLQIDPTGKSFEYVGSDFSKKMINVCHRRFPQNYFSRAPAHDTGFTPGIFDVVLLRHVLEHLEDGYEAVMAEALRITKNLVVVVFFEPLIETAVDVMVSPIQTGTVGAPAPLNKYSRERWLEFLKDLPHAGFLCGEDYYENQVFLIGKDPMTPVHTLLNMMMGGL